MKAIIFPYNKVSTSDLEDLARSVMPQGKFRKKGHSENRYKSYLAGRCAIKVLFLESNATHLISPHPFYGFLEVVSPNGKRVENCFVNVSHTDEVSVAVLSKTSVGIDIEKKSRSAAKVLARVATQRERTWAAKIPGRDIHLWSAKEAAAKAYGLGMKFGLKAFEILPNASDVLYEVKTELETPLIVKDPVILQEQWEDYILSFCSEKSSVLGGVDRRVLGLGDFAVLR